MRNRLLLLAILLLGGMNHLKAQNYNFSAQTSTYPYQTLYYRILYAEDEYGETTNTYTVEVVSPEYFNVIYESYNDPWDGYTRPSGNLEIPQSVYNDDDGYSYNVVAIGRGAFVGCGNLTSVQLPLYMDSIGDYAFYGCSSLSSILSPNYSYYYNYDTNYLKYVKSIGESAFANCSSLTSIKFNPELIDTIGGSAFSNCYGLSTVSFRETDYAYSSIHLRELGNYIFSGCSNLTAITIPPSVRRIGNSAFEDCEHLSSVVFATRPLPAWVEDWYYDEYTEDYPVYDITTIDALAFYYCGLDTLTIPDQVSSIGNYAFDGVTFLTYHGTATGSPWGAQYLNAFVENDFVYADSAKTQLQGYIGTDTNITIPNTVVSILNEAFQYSNIRSVTIPNSVTSIGNSAFAYCYYLSSVTIPNSVTSIGDGAFYNCYRLSSVSIGDSVRTIGSGAFKYCGSLTSVTIPNSVTSIGNYAFYNCYRLTSVTMGNSVDTIGREAFAACYKLRNTIIPDSVSTIGNNAFYSVRNIFYHGEATGSPWGALCLNGYVEGDYIYTDSTKTILKGYIGDSTEITIPNWVNVIGSRAFQNSSITSVVIPSSVTQIADSAFLSCYSLTAITIPNSVTTIGNSAFCYCSDLASVTLGDSVRTIGDYTFYNCTRLTSITIPNSVTQIGGDAFSSCSNLASVTLGDSVRTIGGSAFYNCTRLTSITIPNSVTQIGWGAFSSCSNLASATLGDSVRTIGDYTFYNCTRLTSISIPNSVTQIGGSAFYGCSNLASVTLGDSVSTIGGSAFSCCRSLTSITIPNSVTQIGGGAFSSCSNLASATLGDSVRTIGGSAFSNCTSLTSITIPNSVTQIGGSAFYGCSNLASVTLGDSVRTIGDYTFYNCTRLTSITIPNSVTQIGGSAFYGCSNLASATLGDSVTTIGNSAFSNCTSLTSISIPNSVTQIGGSAFSNCSGLDTIRLLCTTPPSLNPWYPSFSGVRRDIPVLIPCNTETLYAASRWPNTFSNITVDDSCSRQTEYDFWSVSPSHDTLYYKIKDSSSVTVVHPLATTLNTANSYWYGYQQPEGTVVIPDTVSNGGTSYRVTSVGNYAFRDNHFITSINIPAHIDTLGRNAFANCSSLDTLIVNAENCRYWGYNYSSYYEYMAFYGDSITTLFIEPTVKRIPYDAFNSRSGFSTLQTLYYNTDSLSFSGNYNSPFQGQTTRRIIIGDFVRRIPNYLFSGCNHLSSVSISDSVLTIGDNAFSNCDSLSVINIPYSLTKIGNTAFNYCSNLSTIYYNAVNCTQAGRYRSNYYLQDTRAFYGCNNISHIIFGNSVQTIPPQLFMGQNNIDSVVFPNTLRTMGDSSFRNCTNLSYISLNNASLQISKSSFDGCIRLSKIDSTRFVKRIGDYAFYNCNKIRSIPTGDSTTSIGSYAFYSCDSLREVSIGGLITSIGTHAFEYCYSLSRVSIGRNVSYINDNAFAYCSNIDTLIVDRPTPPVITSVSGYYHGTFYNVPVGITVLVPCQRDSVYRASYVWSRFTNISPMNCDLPDLVVANVSTPDSIISCAETSITATISNTGQARANAVGWHDMLYISHSPAFNSSAIKLDSVYHNDVLMPDSSYTVSFASRIPQLWTGETYFYVTTGVGMDRNEIDESNNTLRSDSVNIQLPAILHPGITTIDTACNQYQWHDRNYYYSGTYTYQHEYDDSPCYSYDTLRLKIWPRVYSYQQITIPDTSSYVFFGQEYNQTGTYTGTAQSSHGCDSIVTLYLRVLPIRMPIQQAAVCQGQPYSNGIFYLSGDATAEATGTIHLRDTVRTLDGYDSIISGVNVTVYPSTIAAVHSFVPADDSIITRGDLTLHWNSVAGAVGYRVYLWEAGLEAPQSPTYTTTSTHWRITEFGDCRTYQWRVDAFNACTVASGSVHQFGICTPASMTVSSHTVMFDNAGYNTPSVQRLAIVGHNLHDSIRLTLHGEDSGMFSLPTSRIGKNGANIPITFTPSVLKQNFSAYLTVDCGEMHDTVALQGRMKNLYVFTLSVPDSVLPPGSEVPISGMCENVAGEAQAGVAVDVHINVLGNTTVLTDTTDGAGHFQVTYTPRMSECGYYRVGASLHGQTPTGVLAEFNIPGISLVAPNSTWEIGLNDTVTGYIPVKNRSNITLHNVSIAADSLPAGLNLQFNAITLAPLSTGRIPYTLTCSRLTTGHEYENAYFEATCTEGNLGRVSVRYYCYKPVPDLQISYDTIVCTAVPGSQKTVDIALYNNTDSTFNNVSVQTPTGFSGMSLLLGDSAYAIPPHDSLFIPLLVTLSEGTPLTPITGDILVTAENTQSQNVPFEIDVVSSAIGSLRVLVSNECTYAYGTFVDSATVSVTGYYSLDTVAYAVTDSTGMIVLDSLPEGYYRVHVSATKNNSYDNVVLIAGGHEKFLDVHLEYQAISYSWEVSQTSVDDEWSIHLNTTFETNVPKPVVTLDIPYFNVNFDGSFSTFNIIVSNQGLIDCYDATLIVPESEYYEFVPLFDKIDTLKALTSIPVPCAVRSKAIYDSIVRIEQDCNCTADTIYDTTVWHDVVTQYRDTVIYTVDTIWTDSITYDTIPRYDTLIIPVVKYQDRIDSVITKIVWVDSFYYETVVVYDTVLTLSHESIPQYGNCEDHPFRLMARWECSAGGKPVYAGTVTRKMDCPSTSKDEANSSLSRLRDLLDDWLGGGGGGYDWPDGGGRGPNGGGGGGNSPRHTQQPIPDNDNEWECMPCWAKSLANIMDCGLSIGGGMAGSTAGRAAAATFGYMGAYEALVNNNDPGEAELRAVATSLGLIPHPFTKATSVGITCLYDAMDAVNYCINNGYEEEIPWGYKDLYKLGIEINVDTNIIIVNLKQPKIYYDTIWGPPIRTIFYDTTITIAPEIKRSIIRHMIVNNDTTIQQLKESYDTTIVDIDTTILRRCLIVWKRTVEYMQRGWIDPSLVPNGFSIDYIYYDSSTIRKLMEIEQIAQAQGYQSVAEMFYETARTLMLSPKKSVCAGVALQFSQDVAMTREAFEGVLTLNNPHESNPIRNLTLNFTVSDSVGHDCSDKFDIQIVHRQNIDTTGTLAPKSKGSITVRFVPLMSAAPSHPLPYLFGGSIGYTDPSTSAEMTDELRPVRLTVHPSPHLQLDYFVTHDIIADDPFTAPKIEPRVPATIGLRVRNDGIGTARNVRISSLSPQIVENRQGLVVDFSLFGTLIDGSLTNQPLNDIALGTVLPGEIHTMEYLIKSSLLGIINIKDVDVIHNSSIDDKDMSLVSARAHRLMKTILEYSVGADAIHDFLTNNSGSPYPDSIYFSSGKTLKVHHINDATYDHNVNYIDTIYHDDGTFDTLHITDTIVQVTITPDSVGWQYASTLDPGEGKYEIVSCIRDDSTVIPLDNIWLTFVDLESGNDPNYINRMHIVDTISAVRTTSYNVTFRLKKDMLEVSSINDIPSIELFGNLDSFSVVFNKPIIDSSFSYRDMSLKCNNGVQLMDSTIHINRINDTTFNVNVSNRTAAFGLYVLKVSADSIMDTIGQYGSGGKETRWIQATCTTYYDTVTMESCDSLMWHDTVLYTSCIYQDTLPQLIGGCDSITTLRLTIHNSNNTIETVTACDNYNWHGNTYISSITTPTFSTTNSHGCDSTISLHLTINYSTSGSESVTACDSYTWHDSTYTTSTYTPTYITTNANGCDSTVHLHLMVNYSDSTQMTADVCFGDSLLFNDRWISVQGQYVDTLQTRQGCDSIVMLSLTVNPVSTTLLADTACDSYFWQDSVYTASATTTILTTNRYGCDSTVTLNLIINYSTHDTIVDTAVDSYSWQGHTYTESGEYRFEGQTTGGCDSVIVLQLTVTEVGINSADSAADITLFPNPTKGKVTIQSEGVVKVDVYDQAGRRVAEVVGGNEVDLGHLPSGVYTLHITLQHSATIRRIVKQ